MRLDVPLCTSASHLPCTDSISGIFEAFVLIEFLKNLYYEYIQLGNLCIEMYGEKAKWLEEKLSQVTGK